MVNSRYVSDRWGLHHGFGHVLLTPPQRKNRAAAEQVDRAIEWLETPSDKPFFLFLHNYDVHSDYDPSAEFLSRFAGEYAGPQRGTTAQLKQVHSGEMELSDVDLQHVIDLYDAGILELNSALSRLFDFLERSGLSDNTIVAITSDHGEEFREHGGMLHGQTMYAEVLGVPLILAGPGLPRGVRVRGLAQLTDIFPTLLSLAGLESWPETEGRDLTPSWSTGEVGDASRLAFAEADHKNAEDDIKRMVRSGEAKLIFDLLTKQRLMFDLAQDPGERRDISSEDPETLARLMAALEQYMVVERQAVEVPPLTEEERESLKSLGYIE